VCREPLYAQLTNSPLLCHLLVCQLAANVSHHALRAMQLLILVFNVSLVFISLRIILVSNATVTVLLVIKNPIYALHVDLTSCIRKIPVLIVLQAAVLASFCLISVSAAPLAST